MWGRTGIRRGMDVWMMRRRSLAVAAALVAASLLPGASVSAASSFTFYGSGYGHGLGMSQWGAYGLAQMGWGHRRILTHFYQGSKVEALSSAPKTIRVGLFSGVGQVRLTAKAGPVRLWEGLPRDEKLIGRIPMDATWTVLGKDSGAAVRDAAGRLVGGKRWGGPNTPLFATYSDRGSRVFIHEAGFTYDRGKAELDLYSCGDTNGCQMRGVASMGMDEYLYGLGEVPTGWPRESLKAQAVAARTYAAYAIRRTGVRADCNCHLTDGPENQVYIGYARITQPLSNRWVGAVDATSTQLVTYKGLVIQAFYAASDGGHSDDVQNVWHGGNDTYAIPWLRGVCDPGESTSANPWTNWSRSFDAATITSRLSPYTGSIGRITGFTNIQRTDAGRILSIVAVGQSGSDPVTGSQLRSALGLPDGRVWINQNRNVRGALRETYDDLMCAPGLPTSKFRPVAGGEEQYFQNGGLYRNDAIVRTVWLKGSIDREYRAVGSATGVLGLPLSGAKSLSALRMAGSCTSCQRVTFVDGRIYRKAGVGTYALWGSVLDTYVDEGGAGGALGFPTTRVRNRPDGGTRARFEHGRIVCPAGAGCRASRF